MTSVEQLDLSGIRVLDGGMATELEKAGCDLSGPLWSAHVLREHAEKIQAVHESYLVAGADCILTASYQVSAEDYREIGLAPENAAADLRRSVALAEQAREKSGRPVLIAASLGPYGAALHNGAEYHGNYNLPFDQLVAFHQRRIAVLADTNADLLAFETIPSLEEGRAILAALKLYRHVAVWLSFTCNDNRRVAHGEMLSDCARLLDSEPQVVAVGVNCTAPAFIENLVRELRNATTKPIVVYPNSGETWDAECRCWRGDSDAEDFGALAVRWQAAGAQIVGGCCRTGPEHVASIRHALNALP